MEKKFISYKLSHGIDENDLKAANAQIKYSMLPKNVKKQRPSMRGAQTRRT